MFLGEHLHSLDDKGRLTIPVKYREDLGPKCVAVRGHDGCITLYHKNEWDKVAKELEGLPSIDEEVRKYTRKILSNSHEVDMDRQGRVLLPAKLRLYAGIEKELALIGMGNRIEVWSKERWLEYDEDTEEHFAEITRSIAKLKVT